MNARPKNGFSLIEILVVIVTIGVLAAGAYLVAVNMRTASYEAKLDSDVAMLNRAVRLYETSGGVIAGGYTEEQVLAQLRKVAANTKKVSGLRGSVVDPRLTITRQTAAEAATSSRRAVWNDASKQFEIRTSGGNPGIKAFVLGDVAAVSAAETNPDGSITPAGKHDRRTTFDLAERDNWVWDYTTSTSGSSTGPVTQVVTQGGTSATPSSSDKQLITLDPPDFSLTSGAYALSEFPMTVTLSLPAGVTEENAYVLYVDPASAGSWLRYTGAIQVDPGQVVTAKTVTLDPDNYVDSADQANRYTSVPEVLSL